MEKGISWIKEEWDIETLKDPEEGETSAENNSSIITLLQVDGEKKLFTGDAGAEALTLAIDKADELGINISDANFIGAPHHGSRHNIGPTLLNRIVGQKLADDKKIKTAFVCAPKEGDPKHPSRKVANAFRRRGAPLYPTQGSTKYHYSSDTPDRGWDRAVPLDFFPNVED